MKFTKGQVVRFKPNQTPQSRTNFPNYQPAVARVMVGHLAYINKLGDYEYTLDMLDGSRYIGVPEDWLTSCDPPPDC